MKYHAKRQLRVEMLEIEHCIKDSEYVYGYIATSTAAFPPLGSTGDHNLGPSYHTRPLCALLAQYHSRISTKNLLASLHCQQSAQASIYIPAFLIGVGGKFQLTIGTAQHLACSLIPTQMSSKSSLLVGTLGATATALLTHKELLLLGLERAIRVLQFMFATPIVVQHSGMLWMP